MVRAHCYLGVTFCIEITTFSWESSPPPEAEQQKLAGVPVYAPSAISVRGGKFRTIPGVP